jgi:tetratricopeptide (TPR) repeat protein
VFKILRIGLLVVIAAPGVSASDDDIARKADKAYKQAYRSYKDAETAEAKVAAVKGFLGEYPESRYTVEMADRIYYWQGIEQNDMEGAITFTRGIRKRISDIKTSADLDVKLGEMYSKAGRVDDFVEIGRRLAVSDLLSFGQHIVLMEAAIQAEVWDIVEASSEKARRFTDPEAYRADYPGNVISDELAEKRGRNRSGMIQTYWGWAKANTGRFDEAMMDFESADGLLMKNVIGLSNYPLNIYWGRTLMMQGRHRKAFERLSVDGLIGGNEEALEALKESYIAFNGGEKGFDDYASSVKKKKAVMLEDFTLPGFSEGEYRLAELKGDVTLISFWNPG